MMLVTGRINFFWNFWLLQDIEAKCSSFTDMNNCEKSYVFFLNSITLFVFKKLVIMFTNLFSLETQEKACEIEINESYN